METSQGGEEMRKMSALTWNRSRVKAREWTNITFIVYRALYPISGPDIEQLWQARAARMPSGAFIGHI